MGVYGLFPICGNDPSALIDPFLKAIPVLWISEIGLLPFTGLFPLCIVNGIKLQPNTTAFSRSKFKVKELVYSLFVMFMFINVGSVSLRPMYELAIKLHLNTSLLAVVLISAGGGQATYIFLSRGFVNSIPRELDEAAKIDGCTFFQTFYMVILPLLKPVMGTIALLSFRQGWNEYILPLVFTMTNDAKRPLTVGVNMLKNAGDGTAAWNIMFAGATIAIIPMLVIYCIFSRNFMSGMSSGAVKG